METIINYINEAKENTRWVAIEITTERDYYGSIGNKVTTSKRVVSEETYLQLKRDRRTSAGWDIIDLTVLDGPTRDKDEALAVIASEKKVRKSPINKGNAKYIVYTINCGKFNVAGNTKFDWNIYTNDKNSSEKCELYTDGYVFLYGAQGSLKVGDTLCCVDNDTQAKIKSVSAVNTVKAILPCTSEEDFIEAYRKAFPGLCKPKKYAFGKLNHGLPVNHMRQLYSIKGISE